VKFKEISDLAIQSGILQYDSTSQIVGDIAELLINEHYNSDFNKHKVDYLETSKILNQAKKNLDSAWNICEQYMTGECILHPRSVPGYENTRDVAVKIISTNSTKQYLVLLAEDLGKQAKADFGRERIKLSTELYSAGIALYVAYDILDLLHEHSKNSHCK